MSTATGTTTRLQMRRDGHAVAVRANLVSFDPNTGVLEALFDFQKPKDTPYTMTPVLEEDGTPGSKFTDQNGLVWIVVR